MARKASPEELKRRIRELEIRNRALEDTVRSLREHEDITVMISAQEALKKS